MRASLIFSHNSFFNFFPLRPFTNHKTSYAKIELAHQPSEGRMTREYHSFEDKLKRMVYAVEERVGSGLSMQVRHATTC